MLLRFSLLCLLALRLTAAETYDVVVYGGTGKAARSWEAYDAIVRTLQTLEAGQVSEMAATADQGILVYAQAKKLPDLTPGSPRYAEVEKQLMQYTASANENAYLGELVEQELKLAGLDVIGNVVVGVVALACGDDPFTDLDRHGRAMVLRRVDFWSFHGMRAFLDMARIVPAIDSIPRGGDKALSSNCLQ